MAIEAAGLNEAVDDAVEENIELRLHTGDPGSAGTANEIPTSTFTRPTITGGGGWTVAGEVATLAANPSFGNAGAGVNGVSWVSMWKAGTFWARRALDSLGMDVALGAPVSLTASTLTITATSTDA